MTTALASLLSGRPVKHTVGMTGEVTLQGRVLPIGGLKQKVLAAHAAGLTDVVLPERNRGDLDDIPAEVREQMSFHPVMTVDEVLDLALEPALDAALSRIQNDLFDAGADLTMPGKGKGPDGARLTVTENQVTWLESEIDRLNAELAPLRSFVLPGGSAASAYLHLARTICRRGERLIAELGDRPNESVTPELLKYVNRLSDFLFVAARHANGQGAGDVLWSPGRNR
jgi:cob(I)alamin adenosyltransferase